MKNPLAQNIAAFAAVLKDGGKVPLFYLPSAGGGQSGPAATRSKYNLVLVFLEGAPEGEAYLRNLAAIHPEILACDARLISVVAAPRSTVEEMARRLDVPFTLLADDSGATTSRMLGDQYRAATCVADRYGIIYYLEKTPSTADLPPAATALEWLEFVQIQCPE
jgi:peroxiredoxin